MRLCRLHPERMRRLLPKPLDVKEMVYFSVHTAAREWPEIVLPRKRVVEIQLTDATDLGVTSFQVSVQYVLLHALLMSANAVDVYAHPDGLFFDGNRLWRLGMVPFIYEPGMLSTPHVWLERARAATHKRWFNEHMLDIQLQNGPLARLEFSGDVLLVESLTRNGDHWTTTPRVAALGLETALRDLPVHQNKRSLYLWLDLFPPGYPQDMIDHARKSEERIRERIAEWVPFTTEPTPT